MTTRLTLLLVVVGMGVVYSQSGEGFPPRPPNPDNNPLMECADMGDLDLAYADLDPETRFCQYPAVQIRREYFYCRGTLDEDMNVVSGTELSPFPSDVGEFWTIVLQYPALSYMDVARKRALFSAIRQLISEGDDSQCSNVNNFETFCVSDAIPFYVTEYRESVIITLYNLGIDGETANECFNQGVRNDDSGLVGRFRGKRALIIDVSDLNLNDMFNRNIGPGSSIGDPDDDPTLRPVLLVSFAGNATRYEAMDRVSSSAFASNPNPVNYGLEAGDVVFAVFGGILVVIVLVIITLGFFVHPFFFS